MVVLGLLFLVSALSTEAQTDTPSPLTLYKKIDSLNRMPDYLLDRNPEVFKKYADSALAMSLRINYTKGQIDALNSLSGYYLNREDYVKTFQLYFRIIDIYDHLNDFENLVKSYARMTQLFLLIKDYDLEEKYLAIMARTAKKSSNPVSCGLVFISQAKYYLDKGAYDLAIRNFHLSLPYFQKSKDLSYEGSVYKFLGDAYVQKKMYRHAEYNYLVAVSLFTRVRNMLEVAALYTRIAHIHQVLDRKKLNLEFNLSAMRIRQQTSHFKLIASSYLNVGEAYWLLGNKDSARFYLRKSLQQAEQINNTFLLEVLNKQLSEYAIEEKRYADGLKYFIAYTEYKTKKNQDRNRSEILILEANRAIMANETQNDLVNQGILFQNLQIRNRRIQIFLFEAAFIILLLLIFFIDSLSRKNHKRKNELQELNTRLIQEIDIRIEAEGRLNRSITLNKFLAENTVDVISLLDAALHRIYISPSCERFYGYTTAEILSMQRPVDLIEPSFHAAVNQRLLDLFQSKSSTRFIYKVLRKDRSTFWAEANINPIIDPVSGEVKNLITVVRDVSERMKHDEELSENSRQKEYLLREIHNRVKNNFAILISLMNMQLDQSADPELSSSLTDLQLRVRTMSLVHEQLYKTKEISTIPFHNYLYHLTQIISSSYNNSRVRLNTDIQPCTVALEMALPLGLIINELITNAYKYAFPGDRTGTIWIRLLPEQTHSYCISICDDGVGLPPEFTMNTTQSMGSQIIRILVEQIEATLEVSGNGGACFRILFSSSQENKS